MGRGASKISKPDRPWSPGDGCGRCSWSLSFHLTGQVTSEQSQSLNSARVYQDPTIYIQHHATTYPTAVISSHEGSGAPPEMTWALKSLRPLQVKDLSGPGMVASASSRSRYFSYRKSQVVLLQIL